MSTMRAVVDRVYRDYLHAGDDQPARVTLATGVDADDTSWQLDLSMLPVDAQQVLAGGIIIESGLEQALITGVSGATATVVRGVNGTTAEAHAAGDLVTISPVFGRQVVFDAVADNIVDLFPTVWATAAEEITVTADYTEVPADVGAVTGFRVTGSSYYNTDARLIDTFPTSSTGKAVLVDASTGTTGLLVYRASFTRPTSLDDDLEADLRVRPEWERIVVVGAAAQLLSGRDLDAVTAEWVDEQMQAETFPPTTSGRMSARLTGYHEHLLERAGRRLQAEDRKHVRRLPVAKRALR